MGVCVLDSGGMPLHNEWLDMDTKVYVTKEQAAEHSIRVEHDEVGMLRESIRHIANDMETCIRDLCPDGRKKDLALDRLEECVMWAVKSIERA